MDKQKFEEKIEKSIENAAAHFEQRVESIAAKAEKRIEAAADRFDKSVERATGTRTGKIAVFCINVIIAIALIILAPTALRETLQEKIREMLKNYSER